MKNISIPMTVLIFLLGAISSVGMADDTIPAGTAVASCIAAADASNPQETVTLFFNGGNASDASQYSVHYVTESTTQNFPVQALQWTDGGQTLELRFGNFIVATIRAGESSNNTLGVAWGQAPRPMTCDANFDGMKK
jgi:hypothetical protein